MDNSEKMQTSLPKRHNNSDETVFFATLERLLCGFLIEILLNGCRKFCNFAQNPLQEPNRFTTDETSKDNRNANGAL